MAVAEATARLADVLARLDLTLAKPTPLRSDVALALGRARLDAGQPAAALALLQQADAFWRDFAPHIGDAAEAAAWLARAKAALRG